MKKRLFSLLLVTLMASGCGNSAGLSVEQMKEHIKDISVEDLYPYYKVRGAIDYNDTYYEVDADFVNQYKTGELVPYTRYHPGTYDPLFDAQDVPEEEIKTYANGSKAYWSHVPMRINTTNFYYELTSDTGVKSLNLTCAYSYILHYIKSWIDANSKNANTPGDMIMSTLDGGGFAFSGSSIHSKITIDNFPEYPDNINNPRFKELEYSIDGPYPMFKNTIDGVFNFRFEYNKDGWLTREFIKTIDYDPKVSTTTHFYCEAVYTYEFGA